MTSNDLNLKLENLLKNDDTENFYSLINEIIEENKEYVSDLEQNLNTVFNILLNDINEYNHERKMSFICLFFEILISENIDFSLYLEKMLNLIIKTGIYSDENIKRIINICSNATLNKKILLKKLINFAKNKVEYLYIIFSLVGFKDIIIDNLSENWELIFDLMNSQEIKLNSTDIKNVLKCLELLINLSEDKFKPYASSALYQALDYLSETDIDLQKRSLMIIYSLSKYCDEQLQPLSDHIVDFLKVLERGKNVEINNLCNTMLKHFTGNDDNDNEENENGNENENQEDNEENENEIENNIIDNDDYPENKENKNENEINEEYNEANNRKPDNLPRNKNQDIEEYNYNYEKSPKITNKDNNDSKSYDKYNNSISNNNSKIKPRENYKEIKNREEIEQIEDDNTNNNDDNNNIYLKEKEYNKRNIYEEKQDEYDENKEPIINEEIEKTNDDYDNIDIDAIMKKIKDLSYKQIIILNSIEQYKSDTERIINQKKLKIKSLEEKIEDLEEKIRIEKNKRKNKGGNVGRTNYQMRRKNNNDDSNNNYKNKYEDEDDDYNDYYRYEK